ncbi:MAG: hypothetical protein FWC62_08175 [Firmicutes bacterium]|nr:hypothetical protein [Bacillota bacterium]
MFLDLINFAKLKRALLYVIVMVLCLTVQNSVLSRVTILGARPMFLPAFVVAVGVFSGAIWGGVFGLLTGLLFDMVLLNSPVLFTVALPILGFAAGVLMELAFNRRFFPYFCFCALALLLCALLQCANLLLFSGASVSAAASQLPASSALSVARGTDKGRVIVVALLQVLWALPFAALLYFPCRAIGKEKNL